MRLEFPNKEQMLYSQLAIVDSLTDYLRDNLECTDFDDLELLSHMDKARISLRCAHSRMKEIVKNSQERKSVCY